MSGRVRPHSRGQSHAHVAVRQRGVRLPVLQLWSLSTLGGPGSPREERRCYLECLPGLFKLKPEIVAFIHKGVVLRARKRPWPHALCHRRAVSCPPPKTPSTNGSTGSD